MQLPYRCAWQRRIRCIKNSLQKVAYALCSSGHRLGDSRTSNFALQGAWLAQNHRRTLADCWSRSMLHLLVGALRNLGVVSQQT